MENSSSKNRPLLLKSNRGKSVSIPGLSRKYDILNNQLKTGKTPYVCACQAVYKKKES